MVCPSGVAVLHQRLDLCRQCGAKYCSGGKESLFWKTSPESSPKSGPTHPQSGPDRGRQTANTSQARNSGSQVRYKNSKKVIPHIVLNLQNPRMRYKITLFVFTYFYNFFFSFLNFLGFQHIRLFDFTFVPNLYFFTLQSIKRCNTKKEI